MKKALNKANIQVNRTLRRIRGMGLQVATQKTAAIAFTKKQIRKDVFIQVDKDIIKIGKQIKYLGVILDSKLRFHQHFQYITEKATQTMNALRGLIPNLRGPEMRKRRLYGHVILSILLYAAPVWSKKFSKAYKGLSKPSQNKIARTLAQRAISAYRSVSIDAASIIAKFFPLDLAADTRRRIFLRIRETRNMETTEGTTERTIRQKETNRAISQWEHRLLKEKNMSGKWTKDGILPHFKDWIKCNHNYCNYRITQLLTNHGSLNIHLARIQKRQSDKCQTCTQTRDDAHHVLFECPLWKTERDKFRLSLDVVQFPSNFRELIKVTLQNKTNWKALAHFANNVKRSTIISTLGVERPRNGGRF